MHVSSVTSEAAMYPEDDGFRLSASSNPEQVAEAFEAVFSSMLIKEMRKTLPNGFFGSQQAAAFEGMFDAQLGKAIATSQGLGIAQLVARELEPTATPELQHSSGGGKEPHHE